MADKTSADEKNTAAKRKRLVKLAAVLVLFTVIIIVFGFAWFTFNKQTDAGGINMQALGVEDIEMDMNAYYMEDGDDSWTELGDGIEFIPQDFLTVKFVLSNKTDNDRNFTLDYDSIQVKYYKIQPFLATQWQEKAEGYWYSKNTPETEFPYSKEYVMAGEYVDGADKRVDYHTVSTSEYMGFLRPATNAIRYCISNLTKVTAGENDSQTAANAKAMSLTNEQLAVVKESVKSKSVLCRTDPQDLSVLNTTEPVDVVPSETDSKQLTNILDPSDSGDNYIESDGTIHIKSHTAVVLYMTLYFDPNIYSTATVDGAECTLENSNPFMYQYLYLNKIKMQEKK